MVTGTSGTCFRRRPRCVLRVGFVDRGTCLLKPSRFSSSAYARISVGVRRQAGDVDAGVPWRGGRKPVISHFTNGSARFCGW